MKKTGNKTEFLPSGAKKIYYSEGNHWITHDIIAVKDGRWKEIKPECINDIDSSGRSALYYAAEDGNTEAVKFLLSHPHIHVDISRGGYTPLLAVCRFIADPVMLDKHVEYMQGIGVTTDSDTLRSNYLNIVRQLLDAGANQDHQDKKQHSALHYLVICWGNAKDSGHKKDI